MFCSTCGKKINENAKFCAYCGAAVRVASPPSMPSPDLPAPYAVKKSTSPVLIGAVSAAALLAAVSGVLYFTSHNKADTEETVVSSEKRDREENIEKEKPVTQETDTEETAPASSSTVELLQNYLEEKLVPQYGSANLSAQTKTFNLDSVYEEEEANRFWTNSAGISDAKIYDLDQDGDKELIVFLLTEEEISLCIYEAEDDEIRQTVEFSQKRSSDMEGLDLTWSLLNANGTPYLFCHEIGYGIIYDFSVTNAGLYQYDGSELYSPLVIAQTAGGSSDFVYTAYQYNADGELLEEEIIYDEYGSMTEENNLDWEHYHQRVADLFDAYGIPLDSATALQKRQDIYRDVTKADEYETLLRLEMWGDYRYEGDSSTLVFHFNDFDSPLTFYQHFLSGEETVQIRKDAWSSEDSRTEWSLDDIKTALMDTYLEGNDRYLSVEYAYIDCGGDGVEELAVRFVGLGIYSPDDDSDLTMIITCSGETPEIVYSCESWARSYTSPRYHGCIPSSGSAGAGDHLFGMEYLDANGDLHTVYDGELLGGGWIRDLDSDIYDAVFSDSGDPSADVAHYQIDSADYYVMQSYDTSIDLLCEQYVGLCERKGMHFVTEDEIDRLIEEYAEKLGIEDDWLSEEELAWNYWY